MRNIILRQLVIIICLDLLGNGDVVLSKEIKVVQVYLFGDVETVLSVQELDNGAI